MTCDECRNLLQDFVDAEVGAAEKSALESHITGCVECSRLHRQLSKFTTALVKNVRQLRPSKDFTSKVLAQYHETKTELQRVAAPAVLEKAPTSGRSYPVWPFAAGIGIAVLAGLALLFSGPATEDLGTIRKGRESARILEFHEGTWREVTGRFTIQKGNRVEAVESPGSAVELDFGPLAGAQVFLRTPCGVQVDRIKGTLVLTPLRENPGRVHLKTQRASSTSNAIKSIQFKLPPAWAELKCGEENAADIEPGLSGDLTVSVRKGSAHVGNNGDHQPVAELFSRTVPQTGPCSPAVEIKPGAFDWLEGK